jgi:glutaminase
MDVEMQNIVQSCSAAASGDIESLEKLLRAGADLSLGDYDTRTPLHLASATGHMKVVRFLIERAGVNPSPADRWGATPLNDAKIPEIIDYLKCAGSIYGL